MQDKIEYNVSLKPYHTFRTESVARYFASVNTLDELQALLALPEFKSIEKLPLGGGSNILFTKDFDGLVIKNEIKGIELISEDSDHVLLKVGAGEDWHQFVLYCIDHNYAGIENLSLIPGTVGAAPMQNIGAYGVEIQSVFDSLEAVNIETGELKTFNKADCCFAYRYSIFKAELKNQFIITSVTLRLNKKPSFHTEYGAIQSTLDEMGVKDLTLKAISDAVIKIRTQKLPDPKLIPNAGSFFKNPIIPQSQFSELKSSFDDMPSYPVNEETVKVPAAWLIDQCGFKGYKQGKVGVHEQHALVLVNHGEVSGNALKVLAQEIQSSVQTKFGISLQPEVNMY